MDKITATLYPFSASCMPIANSIKEFYPEVEQIQLVSPRGWGLLNKDAAFSDNRPLTHMTVSGHIDFSKTELLFICSGLEKTHYAYMLDIIYKALSLGKRVVCLCSLNDNDILMLQKYARNRKSVFEYYGRSPDSNIVTPVSLQVPYACKLPVILICGLLEQNNIFEIFLKVVTAARKRGLHPLAMSSEPYTKAIGYYNYPNLNSAIEEREKIAFLNVYFQELIEKEIPDIIILHSPDPIMSYSSRYPNGYGILSYMLTRAIEPDYIICCIQSFAGVSALAKMISDNLIARFGSPIDYVHVSNTIVDQNLLQETNEITCIHIPFSNVNKIVSDAQSVTKIPIYNLLEPYQFEEMASDLFNKVRDLG